MPDSVSLHFNYFIFVRMWNFIFPMIWHQISFIRILLLVQIDGLIGQCTKKKETKSKCTSNGNLLSRWIECEIVFRKILIQTYLRELRWLIREMELLFKHVNTVSEVLSFEMYFSLCDANHSKPFHQSFIFFHVYA